MTDERGFIEVDEQVSTAEDSIWALGDIVDGPMFMHSARDDEDLLYHHLVKDEQISAGASPSRPSSSMSI